jgi:hypothetical protein
MRFGYWPFRVTLLAGAACLAMSSRMLAQDTGPRPAADQPKPPAAQAMAIGLKPSTAQTQSTLRPTLVSTFGQESFGPQRSAEQPDAQGTQNDQTEQQTVTPEPHTFSMSGTVTDVNGDIVPGATKSLDSPIPANHRTTSASDNGFFEFRDLKPGVSCRVTIRAQGFANWTSSAIILKPEEYVFFLTGIKLEVAEAVTSVTVYASSKQIAVEQVKMEEKQRVLEPVINFVTVNQMESMRLSQSDRDSERNGECNPRHI